MNQGDIVVVIREENTYVTCPWQNVWLKFKNKYDSYFVSSQGKRLYFNIQPTICIDTPREAPSLLCAADALWKIVSCGISKTGKKGFNQVEVLIDCIIEEIQNKAKDHTCSTCLVEGSNEAFFWNHLDSLWAKVRSCKSNSLSIEELISSLNSGIRKYGELDSVIRQVVEMIIGSSNFRICSCAAYLKSPLRVGDEVACEDAAFYSAENDLVLGEFENDYSGLDFFSLPSSISELASISAGASSSTASSTAPAAPVSSNNVHNLKK